MMGVKKFFKPMWKKIIIVILILVAFMVGYIFYSDNASIDKEEIFWLTIISNSDSTAMHLVDEQGRKVGTTSEGIVREIPYGRYTPPNISVPSLAGDPDSFFELDESILVPTKVKRSFKLNIMGTDTGSYRIGLARFEDVEKFTHATYFTGDIKKGELHQYEITISKTGEIKFNKK